MRLEYLFIALLGILILNAIFSLYQNDLISQSPICAKQGSIFSLDLNSAMSIAENSECSVNGTLTTTYVCDNQTGKWWIGLYVPENNECNPVCVVDVETKKAVIDWRCID